MPENFQDGKNRVGDYVLSMVHAPTFSLTAHYTTTTATNER
jgi:hypothetical protein